MIYNDLMILFFSFSYSFPLVVDYVNDVPPLLFSDFFFKSFRAINAEYSYTKRAQLTKISVGCGMKFVCDQGLRWARAIWGEMGGFIMKICLLSYDVFIASPHRSQISIKSRSFIFLSPLCSSLY